MSQIKHFSHILMACIVVPSAMGCQMLGIPSYRMSGSGPVEQFSGDACLDGGCAADCPPGIVPPVPNWFAKWRSKEKVPQPPQHPRFQPLPVRPMFAARQRQDGFGRLPMAMQSNSENATGGYGHWPPAEQGGMDSGLENPQMPPETGVGGPYGTQGMPLQSYGPSPATPPQGSGSR